MESEKSDLHKPLNGGGTRGDRSGYNKFDFEEGLRPHYEDNDDFNDADDECDYDDENDDSDLSRASSISLAWNLMAEVASSIRTTKSFWKPPSLHKDIVWNANTISGMGANVRGRGPHLDVAGGGMGHTQTHVGLTQSALATTTAANDNHAAVNIATHHQHQHQHQHRQRNPDSRSQASRMSILSQLNISHLHHRGESWYELFYDLIFVAASLQIGVLLKYDIDITNVFECGLLFLVLRTTWDHLMLYQNRFDTPDVIHYCFYLLQSLAAFVMTLHLTPLDSGSHTWNDAENMSAFASAAAISRFSCIIMYIQIVYFNQNRNLFLYLRVLITAMMVSTCIFTLCASMEIFSVNKNYIWMFAAAVFVERPLTHTYLMCLNRRKKKGGRAPEHFGHMVHRQGTFVMLILGEAIIQLVQNNNHFTVYDYLCGLFGFTIIFNVGDCYYTQQAIARNHPVTVKDRPVGYLWEGLHLLLSLSILFFAVGIKLVYSELENDVRVISREYFMCVSASVSLTLIFILRMMHKGIFGYKGFALRKWSYLFRFSVSGLCSGIPFATSSSVPTVFVLFFLTTMLVLQDTFTHSNQADKDNDVEGAGLTTAGGGGRQHSGNRDSYGERSENFSSFDFSGVGIVGVRPSTVTLGEGREGSSAQIIIDSGSSPSTTPTSSVNSRSSAVGLLPTPSKFREDPSLLTAHDSTYGRNEYLKEKAAAANATAQSSITALGGDPEPTISPLIDNMP